FASVSQEWAVEENPTTLLTSLFQYILSNVKEEVENDPRSERYLSDCDFESIIKSCVVTYPVRHNRGLKLSLVEAALNAGFKFVDGVSESQAAARHIITNPKVKRSPSTVTIVDMGGGSCDTATMHMSEDDRTRQVCATDGLGMGGQTIDDRGLSWLKTLPELTDPTYNADWEFISASFNRCKKAFKGDNLALAVPGRVIPLKAAVMRQFYDPLVSEVVDLTMRQHAEATKQGHRPDIIVLCGGPAGNKYLSQRVRTELSHRVPGIECISIQDAGAVALGALLHMENPLTDTQVADTDLGLEYLEDQSPTGQPFKGDLTESAIGWVIEKGDIASEEKCVIFLKKYRRGHDPTSNYVITTTVYTTNDKFRRDKMQINDRTKWNCRITYPLAPDVMSAINFLGKAVATIRHDSLFPENTSHKSIEARFSCSVKIWGQLLKLVFYLVHEDDRREELQTTFIAAGCMDDPSELEWQDRFGYEADPEVFEINRPLTRKRGRPRRKPSVGDDVVEHTIPRRKQLKLRQVLSSRSAGSSPLAPKVISNEQLTSMINQPPGVPSQVDDNRSSNSHCAIDEGEHVPQLSHAPRSQDTLKQSTLSQTQKSPSRRLPRMSISAICTTDTDSDAGETTTLTPDIEYQGAGQVHRLILSKGSRLARTDPATAESALKLYEDLDQNIQDKDSWKLSYNLLQMELNMDKTLHYYGTRILWLLKKIRDGSPLPGEEVHGFKERSSQLHKKFSSSQAVPMSSDANGSNIPGVQDKNTRKNNGITTVAAYNPDEIGPASLERLPSPSDSLPVLPALVRSKRLPKCKMQV
ncbi:hypothetical protein FE257_005522, partial [Aspergillus nanangensis]